MKRASLLVLVLAGCHGPYWERPDSKPKVPHTKAPVVEAPPPAEEKIAWDDTCKAKFTGDPFSAVKVRNPAAADHDADDGDALLAKADDTDGAQAQIELLVDAIDHYRDALQADNYDAYATYQLAVAYAKLRMRGCAREMIGRLEALATNPALPGKLEIETLLKQADDDPVLQALDR